MKRSVLLAALAAGLLHSATAHAGRSRFGWLYDTDTVPERSVELEAWVQEEDGKGGEDETLVWLAPVVGLTSRLRQAGITVELSPEQTRLGRQLAYADDLHIPYALIIGPDEVTQRIYTLKRLASGEQQQLDEAGLLATLQPA